MRTIAIAVRILALLAIALPMTLSPKGGEAVTDGAGEGVVVPKGFIGTWEMRGNDRVLIIIETKAMNLVHEEEHD